MSSLFAVGIPDDHDRAVDVLDAVQTGRAKGQAREAPTPPGPDDEQTGVCGLGQQHVGGGAFDGAHLDGNVGVSGSSTRSTLWVSVSLACCSTVARSRWAVAMYAYSPTKGYIQA